MDLIFNFFFQTEFTGLIGFFYLRQARCPSTEGFSLQFMVDPVAFERKEVRRLIAQAVTYRLLKSASKR